ncbi:MAG: FeoB-associated Cys-rich membrane protein [Clostridiales bacterium]|nr:FeoB-associated Cys-rich membrane protein [Clostridiales bacterium]
MKYIIYGAVAALAVWAVWYVVRQIGRQIRGKGGCGCGCSACGKDCSQRKE